MLIELLLNIRYSKRENGNNMFPFCFKFKTQIVSLLDCIMGKKQPQFEVFNVLLNNEMIPHRQFADHYPEGALN